MKKTVILLFFASFLACPNPQTTAPKKDTKTPDSQPDSSPQTGEMMDKETACSDISSLDINSKQACTEIGCIDGFYIEPLKKFTEPGTYDISLVMGEKTVTCKGSLPLKPCGERSMTCSDPGVFIDEEGCAVPEEKHSFGNIGFTDLYPQTVTISVQHNGNEKYSQTLTPEYKSSQPNGKGCTPVCCFAKETLSVP